MATDSGFEELVKWVLVAFVSAAVAAIVVFNLATATLYTNSCYRCVDCFTSGQMLCPVAGKLILDGNGTYEEVGDPE